LKKAFVETVTNKMVYFFLQNSTKNMRGWKIRYTNLFIFWWHSWRIIAFFMKTRLYINTISNHSHDKIPVNANYHSENEETRY